MRSSSRCATAAVRGHRVGPHRAHADRVDALEPEASGAGEGDAGQLADRVAHVDRCQRHASLRLLGDAGGDVHDVADHVVTDDERLALVDAGAQAERVGLDREQLDRGEHRGLGREEAEHEPVAQVLDDSTATAAHDRAHRALVAATTAAAASSPVAAV